MKSKRLSNFVYTFYILLCFNLQIIHGQVSTDIRFTNINTNNGLSDNNVNCVLEDNRGFLWVATNDGLCRYDSPNNFKIFYPTSKAGIETLKSSNITTLFIDSKENHWIGTRGGGLSRYHFPTNQWINYVNDPTDRNSLSNNEVLCITEDRQQNIWIGTENGLNLYQPEKEQFVVFNEDTENPNGLKAKAILSLLVDDKGWLWIGAWNEAIHLLIPAESRDIKEAQFRKITLSEEKEKWNVWKIYQDKEERYWIGTFGDGLFLMQLPATASNKKNIQDWQPTFHNYLNSKKDKTSISSNIVNDILQDGKGRLWVATVQGLNHIKPLQLPAPETFNKPTKEKPEILFNHHFYNPNNNYSIAHNDINSIYEDSQGLLRFGTFGGLSTHNWFTNQFSVIEIFGFTHETPNTQNMYVDNDKVAWIAAGTDNGLVKYDLNSGKQSRLDKTHPSAMVGNNVYAINSPNDIEIYIATNSGITIFNRLTESYKKYPTPKWFNEQNSLYEIKCIHVDRYKKIWIGTGTGLFTLNPKTGIFQSFLHDQKNPQSISDNAINEIIEDSYGKLWVATFNGLNVSSDYSTDKVVFQQFKTGNIDSTANTIASNRIISLKQVEDQLFIGTASGLMSYHLVTNKFSNYSKSKNKFWIQSIESNHSAELWMSTTAGIVNFDINNKIFNQFEQDDGLGDLTFRTGSSSVDAAGNYYFGSRQGITAFHPSSLVKNTELPPVFVTEIEKVNATNKETINCINRKICNLSHDDYYLSINFTALNYNRPKKNQYAYKLEGFEDNWNYVAENTPVVYTNLKHGDYTFRVKAANNDGLWNEAGASIKIIKHPAFWETSWFYLLSILCTLSLIFLGNRYHTNNIRQRNIALKKYNKSLNKEIEERKRIEEILKKREDLLEEQSKKLENFNLELKRSNSDLEHFAYAASHDLKEPLRVISSFSGLLAKNFQNAKDKDTAQYIYFIQDGVTRMNKLIQNLLNYARVGKNEVKFTKVKLDNIVATKLFDLSELIKEKNAHIEVDDLPIIYCEKEQISMLFNNLISNAIKFNKKDKRIVKIKHHLDAPMGYWKISVSDNGIGIKPEYQKKIFEIFQRLHAKSEFEGTGIGLALCQKIIDSHKGEITVTSVMGEGTTFSILIPKTLGKQIDLTTDLTKELATKDAVQLKKIVH